MRRDRLTFAMMFGVPIMQLLLFGYAINTDPHHLPAAVVSADDTTVTRAIVSALCEHRLHDFTRRPRTRGRGQRAAAARRGAVRRHHPVRLHAPAGARRARRRCWSTPTRPIRWPPPTRWPPAQPAIDQALQRDLIGPLAVARTPSPAPVELVLQRRYNPEGKARLQHRARPAGVILTMTMVMMTALAITRERERGTMENLLAMPVRPIEVMIGKIVPYIVVGYVQVIVILLSRALLFDVADRGQRRPARPRHALFITVNLALGFTISTVTPEPAAGDADLGLLPAALDPAVGLHVPVPRHAGMGAVARQVLPATHFLRVVRGVMLKGAGFADVSAELAAMVGLLLVVSAVAISRYRVTLD